MTKEEYKAKKIAAMKEIVSRSEGVDGRINADKMRDIIDWFLSQTIDELWALPHEEHTNTEDSWHRIEFNKGFNACLAEAERMRDNILKTKE